MARLPNPNRWPLRIIVTETRKFLTVAEARTSAGVDRLWNPAVVTQRGLHADVAGAVNPLGQTVNANRLFLEFRGQAVQAPADIENLPGRHSPFDQPVTAEIRSINRSGHVRLRKYPCWGLKKLFCQSSEKRRNYCY